MSYPPRPPPMIPGMPGIAMAPVIPNPYFGAMMPPMHFPMGPMMATTISSPPVQNIQAFHPTLSLNYTMQRPPVPASPASMLCMTPLPRRTEEPAGPPVTVFIGNITERAPDPMIRSVLSVCGTVLNWKRVQGASGRLQGLSTFVKKNLTEIIAFGFCEFGNPDAGLRAMRILHDWSICEKKLVVKVDTKAKSILDEYKALKRRALREKGIHSPLQDENPDDENYMDEDMKADDQAARERIQALIVAHKEDMDNYQPPPLKDGVPADTMDLGVDDDERKDIITREIGKFRDLMKKQEEEKEIERKKKEDKDKEKEKKEKEKLEQVEEKPKIKTHKKEKAEKESRRSHSPSASDPNSYSNKIRVKSRDRRRSRSRSRSASIRDIRKTERQIWKEKEEEEEVKDRKKMERKTREKEAIYQEKLRIWEARERKKQRDYDKKKDHERKQRDEDAKEARRLKEFLEDYDDDRDDPKYYKGRELARRLSERQKEIEVDNKDRQREKEELEELRQQIIKQGHPDPLAEFEKLKLQREEFYKPKILIPPEDQNVPITLDADDSPPEESGSPLKDIESSVKVEEEDTQFSFTSAKSDSNEQCVDGFHEVPVETLEKSQSPNSPTDRSPAIQLPKKKKLDIKDVFNTDEEEEVVVKKRKLVPIDYDEEKKEKQKSSEEKRKHIKSIIDKIPTVKEELFSYPIDWEMVDNILMEKRIRPWINKKIIEYIGEPEQTLVDFICGKVLAGSEPQCILDDVLMVLDEEAEIFVVKMWRLLIYEIEFKKLGLGK